MLAHGAQLNDRFVAEAMTVYASAAPAEADHEAKLNERAPARAVADGSNPLAHVVVEVAAVLLVARVQAAEAVAVDLLGGHVLVVPREAHAHVAGR